MEKEPSDSPNPPHSPEPLKGAPQKNGLFSQLITRSTGLNSPDPSATRKQPEKSPWAYAGMGFQFFGTTSIFAIMGYYLDQHMGWTPWGTLGLTTLGLVGGFYLLIKEALRINK